MLPETIDTLVVGAGPAGLATSRELSRRGIDHLVLERGPGPGHTWANLYRSLRLHTGKHLSALPGMKLPRETPLFLGRADFHAYLEAYARRFEVPLRSECEVTHLERRDESWIVHTSLGAVRARVVILATGIVANPRIPAFPGLDQFRGKVIHSAAYLEPADVTGSRVLVVGVGNSGGEIASELARAGLRVDVAVRSGANVVPLTLFGLPIQYVAFVLRRLPRPVQERVVALVRRVMEIRRGPPVLPVPEHSALDAIPLIGFNLVDEIRAGRVGVRPGVERLTADGVRFTDGSQAAYDTIILATGFRPALDMLDGLVDRDAKGFALRSDRVTSADQPRLFFVGHNYDALGGLYNIATDAPLAAQRAREILDEVGARL